MVEFLPQWIVSITGTLALIDAILLTLLGILSLIELFCNRLLKTGKIYALFLKVICASGILCFIGMLLQKQLAENLAVGIIAGITATLIFNYMNKHLNPHKD